MGDWFADVLRLWVQVRGTYVRTVEDVELYVYKDLTVWDRRHKRKAAFALGESVMFRSLDEMTPENIRHELKHCVQIKARGGLVRFLPRYYYESVKAWIRTRDTDNNPFEREAIAAEGE
jgi:hypothetical protein